MAKLLDKNKPYTFNTETFNTLGELREYNNELKRFLASKGLRVNDLSNHKRIDDLIVLLRMKQDLGHVFTNKDHAIWGRLWDWCYNKNYGITNKGYEKLAKLTNHKKQFIQAQQQAKLQRLQKIYKLRLQQRKQIENISQDMTAKGEIVSATTTV